MRKAPAQDGENFFFDLFYSSGRRATRAPLLAYDHSEGASLQMGRGGGSRLSARMLAGKRFLSTLSVPTQAFVSASASSVWGGWY